MAKVFFVLFTVALLGSDQTSGKVSVQGAASVAEGVGFKVVYAKGAFPAPPGQNGQAPPLTGGASVGGSN